MARKKTRKSLQRNKPRRKKTSPILSRLKFFRLLLKNRNLPNYLLITVGVMLLLFGTFTQTQLYSNYLFKHREQPKREYSPQAPTSISIPSVKIDAKVIEGGIVGGNWVLSDNEALYLPTSGKVGEGYNTIIYAHNSDKLFKSLKNIKIGDALILTTGTGQQVIYRITSRENINPYDLKKLYSEEKNIVTLFTCDGWFDSERLLVRAKLIN